MMRCYPVSDWFTYCITYNPSIALHRFSNEVSFSQGVPEQKLRAHLGSFGVTGNLALQPMYTLSGIFSYLILFTLK